MLFKNRRNIVAQKRNTKKNKAGTRKNTQARMVDDVLSLAGTLFSSKKDWVADKVSNLSTATHAYAEALNDIPVSAHMRVPPPRLSMILPNILMILILTTLCGMGRSLLRDIPFKLLQVQLSPES